MLIDPDNAMMRYNLACLVRLQVICGSACNRDPLGGVIGVEQGPLIPMV
jgi:hypothetical protein